MHLADKLIARSLAAEAAQEALSDQTGASAIHAHRELIVAHLAFLTEAEGAAWTVTWLDAVSAQIVEVAGLVQVGDATFGAD